MNAKPDTTHVASPCISVCTIDPVSGLCAGCYRTLDEIAGWIDLTNDAKRELVAGLPERRARLGTLIAAPDPADAQR
jgi:predicted Fe-S protein YdhL (DUF1289 family)